MLIDTSIFIEILRPKPTAGRERAVRLARRELVGGRALLSVITLSEILIGARNANERSRLRDLLDPIPAAPVESEVAVLAGSMGEYARRRGATIPLPDLLIAATAVWLDVPVLACDSDFGRGRRAANAPAAGQDEGARLWRALQIHPASMIE